MRLRAGWVAAAVVAVIAVVAGTFGVVLFLRTSPDPSPASTALTRAQLVRLTSAVHCPPPPLKVVQAQRVRSFPAVAAVLCEPRISGRSVHVVRHATSSGVPAVKSAVLSAPGRRPTAECFARVLPTPRLVLVDASDRWLVLSFPADACGQPDVVVLAGLDRHGWIRLPD